MDSTLRNVDLGVKDNLGKLLSIFWLRRYLLFVPVLLSLPIGLVLAATMPRSFVAKTLLLLQESGGDSPLSREVRYADSNRDRISGLQTLVKSERIMRAVLREIRGGTLPESQIELALAVNALTRNVSLEVLTNDIIEVRLKGLQPIGMGKTLEAITARLLESLLAPEDVILTAPQLLVERRKEQVDIAERALASFLEKERMAPLSVSAVDGTARGKVLEEQQKTLLKMERLRVELAATNLRNAGSETRVAEFSSSKQAPSVNAGEAQRQFQLRELEELEQQYNAAQVASNALGENPADGNAVAMTKAEYEQQRRVLEVAVVQAREKQSSTLRRFGNRSSTNPIQILRAPERITIIDPPKDPEFAAITRLSIVLLTLLSGLLIGIGLSLGADLLDSRIRSSAKLAQLTGVPLWGRLPYGG